MLVKKMFVQLICLALLILARTAITATPSFVPAEKNREEALAFSLNTRSADSLHKIEVYVASYADRVSEKHCFEYRCLLYRLFCF